LNIQVYYERGERTYVTGSDAATLVGELIELEPELSVSPPIFPFPPFTKVTGRRGIEPRSLLLPLAIGCLFGSAGVEGRDLSFWAESLAGGALTGGVNVVGTVVGTRFILERLRPSGPDMTGACTAAAFPIDSACATETLRGI